MLNAATKRDIVSIPILYKYSVLVFEIMDSWIYLSWLKCKVSMPNQCLGTVYRSVRCNMKVGGSLVDPINRKRDKSGTFSIKFQYILYRQAKIYWNLIWKSLRFVSFGANLCRAKVNWHLSWKSPVFLSHLGLIWPTYEPALTPLITSLLPFLTYV